jgi:peptidoglycan/LPS O-acetylase OafA/YrhL
VAPSDRGDARSIEKREVVRLDRLPLLVLLLQRLRWQGWAVVLACGIFFSGVALRAILWTDAVGSPLTLGITRDITPDYLKTIYYPTYCRLDGLLFGVLLAAWRVFNPRPLPRYAHPALTLILGVLAVGAAVKLFHYPYSPAFWGPVLSLAGATLGYPLLSSGCALILWASLDWERKLGSWRLPGVAALATLAYSLYLTHKMVIHADDVLFSANQLVGWLGLAVYLTTSIAVAALLWAAVERPALLMRAKILGGADGAGPRGATELASISAKT